MKRSVALDLDEYDVVVIHYSIVLSDPIFISPHFMDRLRRFRGLKVQFMQDEYRWVDRATAAARDAGINVLFTVAPEPAAGQLYDARLPGVRRVHTLTGYVPDSLKNRTIKPLRARTVDVGYRARDLPYWFGRLSREKAWIGQRFMELAPPYGLRCDVAWREHDRIYGAAWVDFLSNCRTTLGCESGASIADFDGSAEEAVRSYQRSNPGSTFEEVERAVLQPYEGNVIVNVVSPRVFEAASLGTAMVMFPGEYSGVVKPGLHYIELQKDFSNMADVVTQIADDGVVSAMAKRAYEDLIESGNWSYQTFIAEFDRVISEEATLRPGKPATARWRLAQAERAVRVPGLRVRLLRTIAGIWTRVSRRDPSMRIAIEYESQVQKALYALRIVATDGDLRALLRAGRRAGFPLDRLLREIMEVSLLRRAARGRLDSKQRFLLKPEFDPVRRSLCFVSTAASRDGSSSSATLEQVRSALRSRGLDAVEWDHRALGGKIYLDRPAMTVGVGFEGLENFALLARIGRENPALLESALEPALRAPEPDRAADSVG